MGIVLIPLIILALALVIIGFTQPRAIVRWLDTRHPDVVYRIDTDRRAVALTVDDAPSARHTGEILDALARHDARATFFVLGAHAARYPDRVRRIHDEGHETANHFYRDRPTILLGEDALEQSLLATERAIADATGRESAPAWCRPGFGWFSGRVLRVMRRHGYRLALASVYPHDTKLRHPALIAREILRRVRPGDVIVLHDRGYTAAVLERVLPELARRGVDVVTLSELAAITARETDPGM